MMIIPIVLLLHLTMIVPLIVIYRERENRAIVTPKNANNFPRISFYETHQSVLIEKSNP